MHSHFVNVISATAAVPRNVFVQYSLKNYALLGQPQAQELIEIQSFANIITQRTERNRSSNMRGGGHSYCHVLLYSSIKQNAAYGVNLSARKNYENVFATLRVRKTAERGKKKKRDCACISFYLTN
jgi:hypothetical protein